MLRAATMGLLLLAAVPHAAGAAVQTAAIDNTFAMLQAPATGAGASDCEAMNVLRRLSGCSKLIGSGEVRGHELARAYRNRGMALFSLGEKERAVQDFGEAIRFDPANAALYLARGTALQHLGDHDGAVGDLGRAVELEPGNAAAWGNLGVAWEKLGDDDRALEHYDRSLTIQPENATVLNNRGNVLARLGQRRKAIADYDSALRVDPDYASAYYNRAGERCLEGEAGPAVADYLHAIRLGERQRDALRDFLARQGFFDGDAAEAGIESALRRWSASACTAPASKAADSAKPAGAGRTSPAG